MSRRDELLAELSRRKSIGGDTPPEYVDIVDEQAYVPPSFLERDDRAQKLLGTGKDVVEGVSDFVTGIPDMVTGIGKGLGQSAGQLQENPQRFGQNALGGLLNFGSNIGNLPRAFNKYSQSRGYTEPGSNDDLAMQGISLPDKPQPMPGVFDQPESTWEQIKNSIHLPRPGTFNYADSLGREKPAFKAEDEADKFLEEFVPQVAASTFGLPGLFANEFGAERNPFGVAPGVPILKKTVKTGLAGGKKLIPSSQSTKIAEYNKNNMSLSELADNMRAAEGTETPLGNVLKDPKLKKQFENELASDMPYEVQQTYMRINDQIQNKAETLLNERLGKDAPSGDPNFFVKDLMDKAYKDNRAVKNNLYNAADKMAEAEGFTLELPDFENFAKANAKTIQDSPLLQSNAKFRSQFNKLAKLGETEKVMGDAYLNSQAIMSKPKVKPPSDRDANIIANDLWDTGQQMLRSPGAVDRAQGGLYKDLATKLRENVQKSIAEKGSPQLKSEYDTAKQYYKDEFVQFLDKDLYKLLGDGKDPQAIVREIIKPSKQHDNYTLIEKVQKTLPENQKNLLGYSYLRGAVDKSNVLQPATMHNLINSLGKRQFETLFPDAAVRQSLLDFGRLRNMNSEAQTFLLNPKTGARNVKTLSDFYSSLKKSVPGAIGAGLGAAVGGTAGATLGGFLGVGVAALKKTASDKYLYRILTDEAYRNKVYGKIISEKGKK